MADRVTLRGKLIDGQYDREIADAVIQEARKTVDVPTQNIYVCGSWGGYVTISCNVQGFCDALVVAARNMGLDVQ